MNNVFLVNRKEKIEYPSADDFFSPDEIFPEYPGKEGSISQQRNEVYRMVRECLHLAQYDEKNYGTSKWNPLGEVIKPGDTVLIKPNWVENKNKNKAVNDNLECLVTHPSVVRAVCDYVVIALKGKGEIIIADAPMQGCDLPDMFEIVGYNKLFAYLKGYDVHIKIVDMRRYSRVSKTQGVLSSLIMNDDTENSHSKLVKLGSHSLHSEKDNQNVKYKVTDYLETDTMKYHHGHEHNYEVHALPLEADVIINIPKPKTHRLAGMTAAVKNFVGITYEKASLPHRIEGAKECGGDAYKKKSIWKEKMHLFDEKRTQASIENKLFSAFCNDFLMKICYVIGSRISGDEYRIGSWYGNDTIWRTAIDLNYILLHADKEGNIVNAIQRSIITIGDMIVCGQGEGPVGPTPKYLNMIMMTDNTLVFDRVMCEIMGFDKAKLPMFNSLKALKNMGYDSIEQLEKNIVCRNLTGTQISDFKTKEEWHFEPHSCWKGHIERLDKSKDRSRYRT